MSNDGITIEPARPDDLPEVRRLLQRHHLPLDGVDDLVHTMVVARTGSTGAAGVVGVAAVELYPDGALLRSVAVDPAFQSRHLGHALTQGALDVARAGGAEAVFLLTTTAERFFP
jgi:amino-acid N-acetyltransferase